MNKSKTPSLDQMRHELFVKGAKKPTLDDMRLALTKRPKRMAEKVDLTRLYRGGYNPEPYEAQDIGAYGGLFASGTPEPASSHGPHLHYTDIPTNKILTHYALNYEVPHEKVKQALIKFAPHVKEDKELFDKLHDVVVGDKGQDLRNLDDDEILDLLRKEPGADADNEAQRLRGQIAKHLGYHAVELEDEHGLSYLTTHGVKFKPYITKAKGGIVSLLRKHGRPAESDLDAMRKMSNGHRVFIAHEQDEKPREITSVSEMHGYTPDQIYTVDPQHFAQHKAKGGSVPSEPGSTPIKEGHVRLYHQTDGDNLREIEKHGLLLKHAKGIEGPRAIYAGETPFYGDATKKPTLEFQVPKEHWDAPFVLRDVHPQDFISAHYPWHRHARYLEDESGIKNVLSGKFDTLKGDEGKAVEYIKNKYSTKKAKGGRIKGPQPLLPKETVKAYKLFRVDQKQPGKLFPLFVDANTPVEKDKWVEAKVGEMTGNKVKSKIGPLAYRPGWHAGDLPVATHIGEKSDNSLTAPDRRPKNQVWAEVEMPNDVDWQSEANRRGTNKQGKLIPVKAHITDQIPLGGHYRYKTNPNMTGNWLIGGAMKVNRVLPDEEVQKINKKAKVSDLPRSEPINLKDYGFRSGGNVQPLLPKFKE